MKAKYRDIDRQAVDAILTRAKEAPLSEDDYTMLVQIMDTFSFMIAELQKQRTSIARLRALIFGTKTEKTQKVLKNPPPKDETSEGQPPAGETAEDKVAEGETEATANAPANPKSSRESRKGHGRNGVEAYAGAPHIPVPHPTLKHKDSCPHCAEGHVYIINPPSVLVRVTGVAPLDATVYELERLRCNLCGRTFTAPAPDGVGEEKYDAGAIALNGLLKYGAGLPFNRIEKLQGEMGIPLPASTQWDLVADGGKAWAPIYQEIIRLAAQGDVLHNDDTTVKILELNHHLAEADGKRKGVFTTGIVSLSNGHPIALFMSGRQHAGENLADVLAQRETSLPAPIQMCDGATRNLPKDFVTILANCNTHARRKFVEVVDYFPEDCRFAVEIWRKVYRIDGKAKRLSDADRLQLHQRHSQPLMEQLHAWMTERIDKRLVEPNSGLGQAIRYSLKYWEGLTQFLRTPGAPLDNNAVERILKKAILHRKNALFYKTLAGARVGDRWMTVIHTAELNHVPVFPYLVALLSHRKAVAAAPADWMPWNYQSTLAALAPATSPPSLQRPATETPTAANG